MKNMDKNEPSTDPLKRAMDLVDDYCWNHGWLMNIGDVKPGKTKRREVGCGLVMSTRDIIFLLNDEQMSNKVGVEHQTDKRSSCPTPTVRQRLFFWRPSKRQESLNNALFG